MIFGAMNTNVGNELTISGSKLSFTVRLGLEVAITSKNTISISSPFIFAFSFNKSDKTVFMGETNSNALAMLEVKIYKQKEAGKNNKNEFYAGNTMELIAGLDFKNIAKINKARSLALELTALKKDQEKSGQKLTGADITLAARSSSKTGIQGRM